MLLIIDHLMLLLLPALKRAALNGKPKTAEELAERIDWYFNQCQVAGFIPTFEGLAVSINYAPVYLKTLAQTSERPGFMDLLQNTIAVIQMYDSVAVLDGKIPPNTYSFRAKNFYGMRDVTEISPFRPEEVLPDNADDIVRQLPDISEINLKE